MRRKLYLLVACVWFLMALPGAACVAQAVPVLSQIASVLINAKTELARVDSIVQDYLRKTNADEATRERYTKIKDNVLRGIDVANGSLQGTQDMSQGQYDAAFTEYVKAWSEMTLFLKDTGALNASGLRGPDGGAMELPEPRALTFKVSQ